MTPLAALEAARVDLPGQDPEPLDYLRVDEPAGYDIDFEVVLNGEVVSRPPYASMYWSPAQMLAHLTVNGASLRTGDLFASGTISGHEREQRGSFLELPGAARSRSADGRTFLEDGDAVTLRATGAGRPRRPDRARRGDRDDPPGGSAGPDAAGTGAPTSHPRRTLSARPSRSAARRPAPGRPRSARRSSSAITTVPSPRCRCRCSVTIWSATANDAPNPIRPLATTSPSGASTLATTTVGSASTSTS